MIGKIPKGFLYKSALDLVRIGRNNDGGYLVSKSDIKKSKILIGLGINDDWSFEQDFKKIKDIEVLAYDASISQKVFIKQLIKLLPKFYKPRSIYRKIRTVLSYYNFFCKKNNCHIQKFVGLDTDNDRHCSFASVLDEVIHDDIFLKIDIEGSEYRFLNDIIANEKRICGMVIEFHDCDIHLKSIQEFIKKLSLKLIHVHGNNYAPIRATDGLPLVLELSFSKYCEKFEVPSLPHELDMPNGKRLSEIHLIINS